MQLPTKNKEDTSRCSVCHLRIGMPSKTHASLILGPSLASIVRRVSCRPDDAPNLIEALDCPYFTALDSPAFSSPRCSLLLGLNIFPTSQNMRQGGPVPRRHRCVRAINVPRSASTVSPTPTASRLLGRQTKRPGKNAFAFRDTRGAAAACRRPGPGPELRGPGPRGETLRFLVFCDFENSKQVFCV